MTYKFLAEAYEKQMRYLLNKGYDREDENVVELATFSWPCRNRSRSRLRTCAALDASTTLKRGAIIVLNADRR